MRISIIEDDPQALAILVGVLSKLPGVDVFGHRCPQSALEEMAYTDTDLAIIDFSMPAMDGLTFLERFRSEPGNASVPVIMITADQNEDLRLKAVDAGVTDFLTKPVIPSELRSRATNLLSLRRVQNTVAERAKTLEEEVVAATSHLMQREEEIISRLGRAIEYRDGDVGDHISRVAMIARIIGEELGLSSRTVRNLYLAAPLHDIGKIGVPDAILNKPGRLTDEEMAVMRQHVQIGAAILGGSNIDLVQTAADIAESHHEKWDGSGYPRGARGDAIPLVARITAVADVFDALCSDRPYKRAWPAEQAYAEILRTSGSHFDPQCVAAFERGWSRILPLVSAPAIEHAA